MGIIDGIKNFTGRAKELGHAALEIGREHLHRIGSSVLNLSFRGSEPKTIEVEAAEVAVPEIAIDESGIPTLDRYPSFFEGAVNEQNLGSSMIHRADQGGFLGSFQKISELLTDFANSEGRKLGQRDYYLTILKSLGYEVSPSDGLPLPDGFKWSGLEYDGVEYTYDQSQEISAAYGVICRLGFLMNTYVIYGGNVQRNDNLNNDIRFFLTKTNSFYDPENPASVERFGRIVTKVMDCVEAFHLRNRISDMSTNRLDLYPNYFNLPATGTTKIVEALAKSLKDTERWKMIAETLTSNDERENKEILLALGYPVSDLSHSEQSSAAEINSVNLENRLALLILRKVSDMWSSGVPDVKDKTLISVHNYALQTVLDLGGIKYRGDKSPTFDMAGRVLSKVVYMFRRMEVPVLEES